MRIALEERSHGSNLSGNYPLTRLTSAWKSTGKPFPEVFDLALARHPQSVPPARVLMVGDTLHTDILGGLQAGFATVLVTEHGSLAGLDVPDAIARSGIVPDFVVPCI